MTGVSLQTVLEAFNAPVNEEQAWAVCYQCARYLQTQLASNFKGIAPDTSIYSSANEGKSGSLSTSHLIDSTSLYLGSDGNVEGVANRELITRCSGVADITQEVELVRSLGVMIFQALDFGLSESEEQKLSPSLEQLIEHMTGSDGEEGTSSGRGEGEKEGDEGIEDDGDDAQTGKTSASKFTLDDVIKICVSHVENSIDPSSHYKAVCRALVTEAIELTTFLEKIYVERDRLRSSSDECDQAVKDLGHLEALQRTDWARLWMQIMKELRQGVKLKKVQSTITDSVEYELTPYEILMDDLRYKRYTLNKVLLNEDMTPPRVKKDVHAIILDFIRSRPPLHSANERRLNSPPPCEPDARSQILHAIRTDRPQLKPTPGMLGRIIFRFDILRPEFIHKGAVSYKIDFIKYQVDLTRSYYRHSIFIALFETSRTRLDELDGTLATSRKIIKPDLSLFTSNSFDDDAENGNCSDDEEANVTRRDDKNRVPAEPMTPFTPLSPSDGPPKHFPWQQTALDLMKIPTTSTTSAPSREGDGTLVRSRSITICETPRGLLGQPPKVCFIVGNHRPASFCHVSVAGDSSGRRHSITVCESPTRETSSSTSSPTIITGNGCGGSSIQSQVNKFMAADFTNIRSIQSSLECLSLTVEEVMHIRNVLTKAELECLLVDRELHDLLESGKICFTCKKTRFSLFGMWATTCKFCHRSVCSKCVTKMRIPTEHFEHIPVYTLSPSSDASSYDLDLIAYNGSGSVPSSPDLRRPLPPTSTDPVGDLSPSLVSNAGESNMSRLMSSVAARVGVSSSKRAPLKRAQTMARPSSEASMPSQRRAAEAPVLSRPLDGPLMNVCRDCRSMIVNIIRASRRSLAMLPGGVTGKAAKMGVARNFHLDLKPAYREH